MTIHEFLRGRNVAHETLLHRPSPSAAHRAQSVHVAGARVAKAVLVRAGSGCVLAVLPATHRIDLERLGSALRMTGLSIATEDELEAAFPDCERGAVPPFGSLYNLRTVVDASLAAGSEIIVEGNVRHEGLTIRYRDFEAIESPIRARFAEPIALAIWRRKTRRIGGRDESRSDRALISDQMSGTQAGADMSLSKGRRRSQDMVRVQAESRGGVTGAAYVKRTDGRLPHDDQFRMLK